MKKVFYSAILLLAMMSGAVAMTACGGSDNDEPDPIVVTTDADFVVPASMVVEKGQYLTFAVKDGKAPVAGDIIVFEDMKGMLAESAITAITKESFAVAAPANMQSGSYRIYYKHGDRRKVMGLTSITIVEHQIEPGDATLYGVVADQDGNPVAGVQVTDGDEVTLTDNDGVYRLQSQKRLGYVYYTVPSGYEPQTDGVFPQIHKYTRLETSVPERLDFTVNAVSAQDNYSVVFLGDMHLANRTNDIAQFKGVMADFNKYCAANTAQKTYAITLGDMSWDIYWYDNKFTLSSYVSNINECVKDRIIYHCIGNHDNDYKTTTNIAAKSPYRTTIAPNYYSFNIGSVHYVMLDDIDCSNYDGTTSRKYAEKLVNEQIEWLRKDLGNVNKTTPVVIAMHSSVFYPNSATSFSKDLTNCDELLGVVDGYTVHFVTGHTHKSFNVNPSHAVTGGRNVYEHNVPAVCSDWWWSGKITPGCLVAPDGAPSGYAVWTVNGRDISYLYKTAGQDINYQFRSYDLNNVAFSLADVPKLTNATAKAAFLKIIAAYTGEKKNEVLLNIWNYNPKWTVNVTTKDGVALTATPCMAYDPLHIAAQTISRFNDSGLSGAPNFPTVNFCHFFKVTAPDADTDLTITVKDEFGHTWTEDMQRPKPFSTAAYKIN